jgi:hypothetical protein
MKSAPTQKVMPFLASMLLREPVPEIAPMPSPIIRKSYRRPHESKKMNAWRPSKNFGNAIANSLPKEPED